MPPNTSAPSSGNEPPNKYIRTFAGDMETVKKGGVPNLKPLEESTPSTPPAAPTTELPPSAPEAKPAELKPIQEEEPIVPTPVAPKPPPAVPVDPANSPLETYTSDFLQKVKDTRASTATILAAEEDAKTSATVAKSSSRRWSTLTVVVGIVLLLFGATGLYLGYTHYLVNTQPVILAPIIQAPIFVDEKEEISGDTPAALLAAINASLNRTLSPNTIRLLYTNTSTTTDNSIFESLQTSAPGILLRNIDAARSMAGIVNINGTPSPFFILSVASYEDTFAGMLSWESSMPRDLSVLFPSYTSPDSLAAVATTPPVTSSTTASTTPKTGSKTTTKTATTTPPIVVPASAFQDQVIDNHDVRIYLDSQGRSVFLYGYWDKATLVIARDSASFTEILRRLATSSTQ